MAKKIVIDPGHGGEDPGTSANGIVEKDYTLKMSQYMQQRLNDLGIENAITRSSDTTLDSNSRPGVAQSFFGNGSDVILVSNHINAGGGDGAEIIYALRNNDTLSRKIADEFIKSGQNVRKYYQRRLPSNTDKDYYYMLRNTPNNESIIVEYGFVDSTGDDVAQLKNNWQELTEAVVRGLANYLGINYIPPSGSDTQYYTVKKGDTLYGIARNYGVSVNELKEANNLVSKSLSIGQVLIIPGYADTPSDESTYIVKSGDTLFKIANMYNMSVDQLKALNNLTSNLLSIGQSLIVKSNSSNDNNNNTYTVKNGDTLYSIARNFGVSVDEIKRANNKNNNLLSIGEVLVIPTKQVNTHTVKSGDTLWSIARINNTTVDQLKRLNNLNDNVLSIGQVLVIP